MINKYLLGNIIRLSVTFYDKQTNAIVDPTTTKLEVRKPDNTIETITLDKDGIGIYHYDYTPNQYGMYYYNFESFGYAESANQGQFIIIEQSI